MGLTLGEQKCINCREYRFKDRDFAGNQLEINENYRGDFKVVVDCPNCGAEMALIIQKRTNHNSLPTYNTKSTAIAYSHTINDEPCYDESCEKCTGNGKGWWED